MSEANHEPFYNGEVWSWYRASAFSDFGWQPGAEDLPDDLFDNLPPHSWNDGDTADYESREDAMAALRQAAARTRGYLTTELIAPTLSLPKWTLQITPDFVVHTWAAPNRWKRFWQRLLMGWKWERS